MIFKDGLYEILERRNTAEGTLFSIELNGGHPVYQAHFPNMPITPGVCLVQICKELAETIIGVPSHIESVKNVKFISVLAPDDASPVNILISLDKTARCCSIKALISRDEEIYAKISMEILPFSVCVIIPVYNNSKTIKALVESVYCHNHNIIIVNDGSTDSTFDILSALPGGMVSLVSYSDNRGKGYALKEGFKRALSLGYEYAITIDGDGQHFASDIDNFYDALENNRDSIIIGSRMFNSENMPVENTFANKFSNFWFTLQTSLKLSDTQSGYRLYPIRIISGIRFFTSKYETELEILVRCAWKGIKVVSIPVQVYYPPKEERVSHFRKGRDFIRISLLNTFFTIVSPYYYLRRIWR